MTLVLALVLAQVQPLNTNTEAVLCMDEAAYCRADRKRAFEVNCSGAGITCTQTGGRMTLTVAGGGGGAPTSATYITQTPDATLSNEQAMSSLATGLVKNTTGTGVQTIAVSGTDYAPATSGSAILKGNGSGGFSSAVSGTDYAPATSGSAVLLGNGSGGFSSYAGASCTNQFPRSSSTAGAWTCASVALATDVSGTLAQARGGTGAGALTCAAGERLTSNGTAYSCSAVVTQAYTTVEDEGSGLTQRSTVNFTGAGVSCADTGGKTVCTISGGGGGGGLSAGEVQRLVAIGGP